MVHCLFVSFLLELLFLWFIKSDEGKKSVRERTRIAELKRRRGKVILFINQRAHTLSKATILSNNGLIFGICELHGAYLGFYFIRWPARPSARTAPGKEKANKAAYF